MAKANVDDESDGDEEESESRDWEDTEDNEESEGSLDAMGAGSDYGNSPSYLPEDTLDALEPRSPEYWQARIRDQPEVRGYLLSVPAEAMSLAIGKHLPKNAGLFARCVAKRRVKQLKSALGLNSSILGVEALGKELRENPNSEITRLALASPTQLETALWHITLGPSRVNPRERRRRKFALDDLWGSLRSDLHWTKALAVYMTDELERIQAKVVADAKNSLSNASTEQDEASQSALPLPQLDNPTLKQIATEAKQKTSPGQVAEPLPRSVDRQASLRSQVLSSIKSLHLPPLPQIKDVLVLQEIFLAQDVLGPRVGIFEDEGEELFRDNQTLAFIGEGVVHSAVVRVTKRTFPSIRQHGMRLISQQLGSVQRAALAHLAVAYGLHTRLAVPPGVQFLRERDNMQADVFLAYVGGMHQSLGSHVAAQFLEELLAPLVKTLYPVAREAYTESKRHVDSAVDNATSVTSSSEGASNNAIMQDSRVGSTTTAPSGATLARMERSAGGEILETEPEPLASKDTTDSTPVSSRLNSPHSATDRPALPVESNDLNGDSPTGTPTVQAVPHGHTLRDVKSRSNGSNDFERTDGVSVHAQEPEDHSQMGQIAPEEDPALAIRLRLEAMRKEIKALRPGTVKKTPYRGLISPAGSSDDPASPIIPPWRQPLNKSSLTMDLKGARAELNGSIEAGKMFSIDSAKASERPAEPVVEGDRTTNSPGQNEEYHDWLAKGVLHALGRGPATTAPIPKAPWFSTDTIFKRARPPHLEDGDSTKQTAPDDTASPALRPDELLARLFYSPAQSVSPSEPPTFGAPINAPAHVLEKSSDKAKPDLPAAPIGPSSLPSSSSSLPAAAVHAHHNHGTPIMQRPQPQLGMFGGVGRIMNSLTRLLRR